MARNAKWLDTLFGKVRTADTDEEARTMFDELMQSDNGGDDKDQHIHVHLNGSGGKGGDDDTGGGDPDDDQNAGGGDLQALSQRIAALEARLDELDDGDVELEEPNSQDARKFRMRRGKKMTSSHDEADVPTPEHTPELIGETDLPGIEDLDARMAAGSTSTGDRKKMRAAFFAKARTGDSADMEDSWKETIAAAVIILPDVKVPSFDSRLPPIRTADRLCALRRRVMDSACKVEAIAAVVKDATGLSALPPSLGCDSVKMAFNATALAMKNANNSGLYRREIETRTGDGGGGATKNTNGITTLSEINKRNKEAWADPKSFNSNNIH